MAATTPTPKRAHRKGGISELNRAGWSRRLVVTLKLTGADRAEVIADAKAMIANAAWDRSRAAHWGWKLP